MIRSNQAGQAKNRPPRREEGENGNLQRFPQVNNTRYKPNAYADLSCHFLTRTCATPDKQAFHRRTHV
ncbi:hypothetical protein [Profundibacter sp.]|uniref:hypothetical protein n=1 Tax=Profundibacter sp. TaxID=3101071 RepID=UPI003D0F58D6